MSENTDSIRIDACGGVFSARGKTCDHWSVVIAKWAESEFDLAQAFQQAGATEDRIAERLREVSGHEESTIGGCRCTVTIEQAWQELIVLCRRKKAHDRGDLSEPIKCLSAVGSDHGRGVVGRMASGRAALRDPAWPILPGFDHVPWSDLARRIDDSTAMVLVSPIDLNQMAAPRDAETLRAIRTACDKHGAALIIDHSELAPMGGGYFWVHDSIAPVTADAVVMSAGLLGGMDGALIVFASGGGLSPDQPHASTGLFESTRGRRMIASLVEDAVQQWIDHDWLAVDTDEFAVRLAERLSAHETIRDLNATGRMVGIEMDLPSADWIAVAEDCRLHVRHAGEFGVRMQPPLLMSESEQTELIDRIDLVFQKISESERSADDASSSNASDDPQSEEPDSAGPDSTDEDWLTSTTNRNRSEDTAAELTDGLTEDSTEVSNDDSNEGSIAAASITGVDVDPNEEIEKEL